MKSWYQSKTIWIAVIQGILGVVVAFTTIDPAVSTIGWIAAGKAILDMVLRSLTTTPIA